MVYYFEKKKRKIPKVFKRLIGVGIIFVGFSTLLYFFFPIILYQVFFGFSQSTIDSPIPKYAMVGRENSFSGLISQGLSGLTTDFSDARNWYPNLRVANSAPASKYSLSIPRLKIYEAEVSTVDYDLEKHLIQYAGTSLPGENGTSVIFGHSTLPQWFDPKNYKTIFATLHTIKNGDIINADVNGVKYSYKVFSITVTSPEDTNMFEQSFDTSYITIVTCTPPGTLWKRLIVRASLQETGKESAYDKDNILAQLIPY